MRRPEFCRVRDQEDLLLEEVRRCVATAIGTGQPLDVNVVADRIARALPQFARAEIVAALTQAAARAQVAIRFQSDRVP